MNKVVSRLTQAAVANRIAPGGVLGVVRKNGKREVMPFGRLTYEEGSPIVRADTVYDLASITKVIPTASLALKLLDEGRIKLDDRLIDYVPEFNNNQRELVRIKHLLAYTLDVGYNLSQFRDFPAREIREIIMTRNFGNPPGTVFKYTNVSAYLLGLVVEKAYGETLDVVANREFFNPLAMNCTFHTEKLDQENIAPTEIDAWRGLVQGKVHDESAYAFAKDGVATGHAGLFGTADALLNFIEMLLNEGQAYFSPEMVQQMCANQLEAINQSAGLGWELNQPWYMGIKCGQNTFGKTGFTGTCIVIDPDKGIGFALLTNRTYPKRSKDSGDINALRAAISETVLQ